MTDKRQMLMGIINKNLYDNGYSYLVKMCLYAKNIRIMH